MGVSRSGRLAFIACVALFACDARDGRAPSEPAPDDEGDARPAFCDRADDDVTALFCSEDANAIESLADLKRELGLDRVLWLAHSTALNGRLASPINPRALLLQNNAFENGYAAATFTRGAQRVELVSFDRQRQRLSFYLVDFEQACNDQPGGCTPGDLFTPAVESGWRNLRVRDDEQLKNTPEDCRRCHGGSPQQGDKPMLLMRELDAPWLHWFSQISTLHEDFAAAKRTEPYAGTTRPDDPNVLERHVRLAERVLDQPPQPLAFVSGVIGIETAELQTFGPLRAGDDDPEALGSSPTWQLLYDWYRNGSSPAPPYHHDRSTDPEKLRDASDAYRAYLDGELEASDLPDISDVLPDDPRRLAEMSFAVDPEATDEQLLVQACGDCHNGSLDPTLSRARFDIDLSKLTRATLALASARLDQPEDAAGAMPPPGARQMSREQRRALGAYLRSVEPDEIAPRPPPQARIDGYSLELGYAYQGAAPPDGKMAIGDLSGDGRDDLLCSPWVFPQSSDGALSDPSALPDSATVSALADVDGDGLLDLVTHGAELGEQPGLVAYLSEGDLGFSAGIASSGPDARDLASGSFGDVDRDGHLDLVTRTRSAASSVVIYLGDGEGGFAASELALGDAGEARWVALTLGDVTGDEHADLVLLDRQDRDALVVYAHDGDSGFQRDALRYELPYGIVGDFQLSVGDANDDGRNDVAISPGIRLLLQDARGRFGAAPLIDVTAGPAVFFDMNADGRDDLVALAADRGEVRVLLQGSEGLTRPATIVTFELPSTPGTLVDALAVGDLSSDGCPDVAVARVGSVVVVHGAGCEAVAP